MKKKLNMAFLIFCILLVFTACGRTPGDPAGAMGSVNEGLISNAETTTAESEAPADPAADESEPPAGDPAESTPTGNAGISSQAVGSSKPAGSTSSPAPSGSTSSSKPADPPPTTATDPLTPPKNASSADGEAIANKIIEYINQYRVAQGSGAAVKLPGLTKVAEYRSNQLVTNYKHDTNDTREATRYYQYGKHVVHEEYGLDHYDHCAREAIGRSGGNYSIDEVANIMATGFKDSAGHWDYVGAAEYGYIAVGATYGNNQWYVTILMSRENTYG